VDIGIKKKILNNFVFFKFQKPCSRSNCEV